MRKPSFPVSPSVCPGKWNKTSKLCTLCGAATIIFHQTFDAGVWSGREEMFLWSV